MGVATTIVELTCRGALRGRERIVVVASSRHEAVGGFRSREQACVALRSVGQVCNLSVVCPQIARERVVVRFHEA